MSAAWATSADTWSNTLAQMPPDLPAVSYRMSRAGLLRVVVTLDSSFSGFLHSVRTSPSAHMAKTGVRPMMACSAAWIEPAG